MTSLEKRWLIDRAIAFVTWVVLKEARECETSELRGGAGPRNWMFGLAFVLAQGQFALTDLTHEVVAAIWAQERRAIVNQRAHSFEKFSADWPTIGGDWRRLLRKLRKKPNLYGESMRHGVWGYWKEFRPNR